ncbi:hypothetical protein D3C84_875990 [compost metagenome]
MVLEECGLLGVERTDVQGQLNAPLQQGLLNAGLGTQQVAGVSEGNPATVEQLVDVRGEQKAVVAIEALGVVVTLRPGLDVAGNQQGFVGDAGDPAGGLYHFEPTTEEALADASFGELQLLCDFKGRGLDIRLNSIAFQLGLVLLYLIGKVGVYAIGQ